MVPKKKPDDSTYSGRFAIRLYELRKKAGLSAEDMAARIGVPAKSLYDWEAGKPTFRLDLIPAIAEVFNIEPRTLMPKK